MKQNQKLLVVNINEFNYDFLLRQSKVFKCKNIIKFFVNFDKSKTFTLDKIQHENLDPWVQEVSINTGKNSKKHKIRNLGEKLNSNIIQIWDLISKKFTVSVWGSMNSQLRDNKNINIFFPDPWNFTSKIKPQDLENLFSEHGTVTSAKIITDRMTNRSRGFGFVEMSDGAEAAIEALNEAEVDGRKLVVNESRPKESR